ncbi:DUF6207 family protein (plasmid) [Streptomyces sp. NBC_01210]|uniref:DUF6207 family protein n=1 Tax=Streptomyces sp. NBC_01210 TaxID=2903774 RepID=UPI002E14F44C|nr:DUF6207 family protein [Streptomyces sp. NBC_01210]
MDRIDEQHVSEPGLVVIDITAQDEETALAVMSELEKWWATSGVGTPRRAPGQPGVKARVYADIRRSGTQAT